MKKLKLISSISLLCLAISMLCVGVFAITDVTYTIGGNISYQIEDVYAQITTKVFKSETKRTAEELQQDVSTLSSTSLDKITYSLSQDKGIYNSFINSGTASANGIEIKFGQNDDGKIYYTYYIVANVENLSTIEDMYANVEYNGTNKFDNVLSKMCFYQDKILKGEKNRNIIIAYSLDDVKISTSINFSYTLKIKKGDLYIENSIDDFNLWNEIIYTGNPFQNIVYDFNAKMSTITINTLAGWENLCLPLNVSKNTNYKISLEYETPSFSKNGDGFYATVLFSTPPTTEAFKPYSLAQGLIEDNKNATIEFEFNSGSYDKLYLDINHGGINDGQIISYKIGKIKISKV